MLTRYMNSLNAAAIPNTSTKHFLDSRAGEGGGGATPIVGSLGPIILESAPMVKAMAKHIELGTTISVCGQDK